MERRLERITGKESLKKYFDSDYLGAAMIDAGAEPVLTIASFWQGNIVLAGGRTEPHVVMRFAEKSVEGIDEVKPMILNATNRKTLKKLYGADTPEVLEGKQIQLYVDPKVRDPQDGGFTEGLRIRPHKPRPQQRHVCSSCGGAIEGYGNHDAAWMADYTKRNYGAPLCSDCAAKVKAERDANSTEGSENDENGAAPDTNQE